MAVRNGMPFLPATLASIEKQTYPHFEILAWDNGSTDGTAEELRKWIPSRLAGRIIADRPLRLGLSRAALVQEAKTEYCAWSDAEDISHPKRIEEQVRFLDANSDAVLVGSQIQIIDYKGRPSDESWVAPTDDAEVRWATRWRHKNLQPSWLFRRSKVLAAGNYRDCRPAVEDLDMLMRLSLLGSMPNLPETLLQYRRHAASVTAAISDPEEIFRESAELNADILFPGIGCTRAMQLWESARSPYTESTRISDVLLIRRASGLLAKRAGLDPGYFRRSALYREQEWVLRQKCIASFGLQPLVGLKHKLAHALRPSTA